MPATQTGDYIVGQQVSKNYTGLHTYTKHKQNRLCKKTNYAEEEKKKEIRQPKDHEPRVTAEHNIRLRAMIEQKKAFKVEIEEAWRWRSKKR